MEYQKNIASNVYHGFGALVALIITYAMMIKVDTGLAENTTAQYVLTILMSVVFFYHMLSMKNPK